VVAIMKVENIPQSSTFDTEHDKKLVIASPIYDYAEVTKKQHELSRKITKMYQRKM
jgi:hypothetical protein